MAASPSVPCLLPSLQRRPQGLPHWVPYPSLEFVDRPLTFLPVPARTPFTGAWVKDAARTTAPKPIDDAQDASTVTRRTHESINALEVCVLHDGFA